MKPIDPLAVRTKSRVYPPIRRASIVLLLMACSTSQHEASVALSETDAIAPDTVWVGSDSSALVGDVDQIDALSSGELIVVDRTDGSVKLFSSVGRFIRPLITAGSGPAQALQPFNVAVDGDTLFVTALEPGERILTWLNLRENTSGRVRLITSGSTPIMCAANATCLARPGPAWTLGTPFSRPGQALPQVTEIGWVRAIQNPHPSFQSIARLPGALLVSFEWPNGPAPLASGAHEFSPGALIALNARDVWALDDSARTLFHWKFGDAKRTSLSLPTIRRFADWSAIADTTEALIALSRTPLGKNRLRATRDPALVRGKMLPTASRLVLGSPGRALIQLYADGDRAVHHYLLVTLDRIGTRLIAVPGNISLAYVGATVLLGTLQNDTGSNRLIALRLPPSVLQ